MNSQEAFDTALKHMRAQKRASQDNKTGSFKLRGPEGTKCSIGILIPDEQYEKRMEMMSIRNIWPLIPTLKDLPYAFLLELNRAHDSSANWNEGGYSTVGEERMQLAAKEFNLMYVPVR